MDDPMTILEAAARAMCQMFGEDPDAVGPITNHRGYVSGWGKAWGGFTTPASEFLRDVLGFTPEGSFVVVPAWFAEKSAEMEKAKEEHRQRFEEARASIRRGARPAGTSFTLSARPGAKEGGA